MAFVCTAMHHTHTLQFVVCLFNVDSNISVKWYVFFISRKIQLTENEGKTAKETEQEKTGKRETG